MRYINDPVGELKNNGGRTGVDGRIFKAQYFERRQRKFDQADSDCSADLTRPIGNRATFFTLQKSHSGRNNVG